MIARIVIYLILIIVLSDLYIDMHYFRKRYPLAWWQRLLWWLPCISMVIYTCAMASIRDFAPNNLTWLNTYIFLLGLLVGPKAIFTLISFLGSIIPEIYHPHKSKPGDIILWYTPCLFCRWIIYIRAHIWGF